MAQENNNVFFDPKTGKGSPRSLLSTGSDEDALSGISLIFHLFDNKAGNVIKEQVKFQFAPKVNGDSRRGNWDERDVMGIEPVAIYKGSGPRTISLQITYIYDGDMWDSNSIRSQINLIRGYFIRAQGLGVQEQKMVVLLKLWGIGGKDELSFRMRSVDVKYSETMIKDIKASGNVEGRNLSQYFPLRTDITIELASWTKGWVKNFFKADVDQAGGNPAVPAIPGSKPNSEKTQTETVQDVKGMRTETSEDWY